MIPNDRAQFIELLQGVYALYRVDFSPLVIDLWWRALEQYELAGITAALTKHAMNPDTGQFVPKPADVVKMLGGTTKDAALLAWAKVERAVRSLGSWTTVVFDDPIIHRVLEDLGGWTWLCAQNDKEWPHVERRFCDHYRLYKARGEMPEHQQKLLGHTDVANIAAGYQPMNPALVGDPWVCARVLSGEVGAPLIEEKK